MTLVAGLLLGVMAATLYAGWRQGRLGLAFAVLACGLFAIWIGALLAINTDYRDADGFVDCWPSCTRFQGAVQAGFWLPLPALGVLAILFGAFAFVTHRRGRAARRPG